MIKHSCSDSTYIYSSVRARVGHLYRIMTGVGDGGFRCWTLFYGIFAKINPRKLRKEILFSNVNPREILIFIIAKNILYCATAAIMWTF